MYIQTPLTTLLQALPSWALSLLQGLYGYVRPSSVVYVTFHISPIALSAKISDLFYSSELIMVYRHVSYRASS